MTQETVRLPLVLHRHKKALVPAATVFFFLLFLNVVTWKFWPEDLGYQWIPQGLLIVLNIAGAIVPYLRWKTETFTVTKRSIRNDWGILYKQSREIDLTRIASISEERGILDRIFGCGTLNFYDAAAGAQPNTSGLWNKGDNPQAGVRFHDVPEVKKIRLIVEKAKDHALAGH